MFDDCLTGQQLENLPEDSVILDCANDVWQKYADEWYAYGMEPLDSHTLRSDFGPIALIWKVGG
ncbi:hypothetical protein LA324_05180 [Corynebacterium coyleae]|uniref:hypothetical protein n=1 Tax=Corynebacterium coyleae TaxID=53374 RepID=UPI001CCD3A37|nr:hypothetical protein [Corynebacterium coyleae]UBI10003.1 hypothetical protein LA324_05180 [Corynebacterium coyleae]